MLIFISTENLILSEDGIQVWFLNLFWCWFFSDAYVSFFFRYLGAHFFQGFFNATWISPLLMGFFVGNFVTNRPLFHYFSSLFFHLVVRVGSAQWFAFVVVGEKWKSLCIIYCRLKIWTHPPRLGRSGRNFRSCLRYFG